MQQAEVDLLMIRFLRAIASNTRTLNGNEVLSLETCFDALDDDHDVIEPTSLSRRLQI